MGNALVESFCNAALRARPVRRQADREIAIAERQHGGEELPGTDRGWIFPKMLSVAGRG